MKRFWYSAILSTVALVGYAQLPANHFATGSILSEGRWVKVETDTTGVYQITHSQLAEMGFTDPSKVAVYGNGARPMGTQFTTDTGIPLIAGSPEKINVKYCDDKILFYVQGPELLTIDSDATGPYYKKQDYNIYSRHGYYLLTDASEPQEIPVADYSGSEIPENLNAVWRYQYFEDDKIHGLKDSGQIFWAKQLTANNPMAWYNAVLPDADISEKAMVDCGLYASNEQPDKQMLVSFSSDTEYLSFPFPEKNASAFANLCKPGRLTIPKSKPKLRVGAKSPMKASFSAVDYFLISYRSNVPSIANADMLVAASDDARRYNKPSSFGAIEVWNITNPKEVIAYPVSSNGQFAIIPPSATDTRIAMFDPTAEQYSILGWTEVNNCDIRAYAELNPQMLIITTASLKEKAQELADLHSRTDGTKVVVATVEEIYNEFNGGTPDVMAYRTYIRMLYDNTNKALQNVLLFGPLSADIRGINNNFETDATENIIAFQNSQTSINSDSANVNDFLCIMQDFISQRYEYCEIPIGIGVIPVRSEVDANNVISKIEHYLTEERYDQIADKFLGIAGSGDQNLHSRQMIDLSSTFSSYLNNSFRINPILFDAYPRNKATDAIVNGFNDENLITLYMGHSGMATLNGDAPMKKSHISKFNNDRLTFTIFGSCDITDFDHNKRGMGEAMFMDINSGSIGGMVSTRTAWSSQNEAMVRQLFIALTHDASLKLRNEPASIGQAFAIAKSRVRSLHEHTFQLLGDPSLILPIPIWKVGYELSDMSAVPGTQIKITGKIQKDAKNNIDNFNGYMTASLMAPSQTFVSPNCLNGDNEPHQTYVYEPGVLSTSEARVVDGNYEIYVDVPANSSLESGSLIRLSLCAYDPELRRSAASSIILTVEDAAYVDEELLDTEAPQIVRFEYNNASKTVDVEISDNRSLPLPGRSSNDIELNINGTQIDLMKTLDANRSNSSFLAFSVPSVMFDGQNRDCVAMLEASDNHGNKVSSNITFSTFDEQPIELIAEKLVGNDIRFSVAGEGTVEGTVYVADLHGTVLTSGKLDNIDLSNLADGIYKAWIVTTSPVKSASNQVTFAIISGE